MSENIQLYTFKHPSAETLTEAVRVANDYDQGNTSSEEQSQANLQLGFAVITWIENRQTKEQIHDQLAALGLRAEIAESVYEKSFEIHLAQEGHAKQRLISSLHNGSEKQKNHAILLITLARNLMDEGKSKSEIIAELQSDAEIDESMANAVIELIHEIDEEVAASKNGILVFVGIMILVMIISYFISLLSESLLSEDSVDTVAHIEEPEQEINCTSDIVLLTIRKSLVSIISDYRSMTYAEHRMQRMLSYKGKSLGDVEARLNGLKIKYLSPDSVTLSEISQIPSPASNIPPVDESLSIVNSGINAQQLSSNKAIYMCKAIASIQLPTNISEHFKENLLVVASELNYKNNTIQVPIYYQAELYFGGVRTGITYTNPMMDPLLAMLYAKESDENEINSIEHQ